MPYNINSIKSYHTTALPDEVVQKKKTAGNFTTFQGNPASLR